VATAIDTTRGVLAGVIETTNPALVTTKQVVVLSHHTPLN